MFQIKTSISEKLDTIGLLDAKFLDYYKIDHKTLQQTLSNHHRCKYYKLTTYYVLILFTQVLQLELLLTLNQGSISYSLTEVRYRILPLWADLAKWQTQYMESGWNATVILHQCLSLLSV